MGEALAGRGLTLVYGGGRTGLMGHLAEAGLAAGSQVIGVIPRHMMTTEIAFTDLADLRVVETMHQRKALMAELADGFVALPGGLGTIEEFFEMLTWAQLELHHKPCGLLNVCGYYDRLLSFLDHAAAEGFVHPQHRQMIVVAECAGALLDQFETYRPPRASKLEWALRLAGRAPG
jgi:hypothetical protein